MSQRANVLQSHLTQHGLVKQVRDATGAGRFIGYGKVILFGEHFVVYNHPAVVCAVREFTDCEVRKTPGRPGWTVVDERPAVPGYIVSKREEQKLAHDLVVNHLRLDLTRDGIEIKLGGPLVPTSGIGASASNVTALARACSHAFDLNLDDAQVNAAAYVGEGGYHGTPSGIDNTAATYGGLLSFQRTSGAPKFGRIEVPSTGYLVVVSTGITASTTKVVGEVRKLREQRAEWFAGLEKKYLEVLEAGVAALQRGDWKQVGELMNVNHEILCSIGLTIPELDSIVSTAREAGALGAKLSGTGRGGIAIALCESQEMQQKVARRLRALPASKFVWEYSFGAS